MFLKNFNYYLQVRMHNLREGLWDIPLVPFTQKQYNTATQLIHKSNVIIPLNKSPRTLIQYLRAVLFSPTKTTLLKVVWNRYFLLWPGLTVSNIGKLLDETPATALGHLDQEQQGLQSSKLASINTDYFPIQESHQAHYNVASIVSFCQHHKAFF